MQLFCYKSFCYNGMIIKNTGLIKGWWVYLLSIDQQIGGVFGGPIDVITHPNELL